MNIVVAFLLVVFLLAANALTQRIEKPLGLGIDPVQVFKDEH